MMATWSLPAASSRATNRRSRVTARERAASMLSQRLSCPAGTARFPLRFSTRAMDIRSAIFSAKAIATHSKRPFARSWHPTRVPLPENEVASSFLAAPRLQPPTSDIAVPGSTNSGFEFPLRSAHARHQRQQDHVLRPRDVFADDSERTGRAHRSLRHAQSVDAGKTEEILAARRDLCFACAQRPLRRLRRIGKEA